jgi:hypothetical protein
LAIFHWQRQNLWSLSTAHSLQIRKQFFSRPAKNEGEERFKLRCKNCTKMYTVTYLSISINLPVFNNRAYTDSHICLLLKKWDNCHISCQKSSHLGLRHYNMSARTFCSFPVRRGKVRLEQAAKKVTIQAQYWGSGSLPDLV